MLLSLTTLYIHNNQIGEDVIDVLASQLRKLIPEVKEGKKAVGVFHPAGTHGTAFVLQQLSYMDNEGNHNTYKQLKCYYKDSKNIPDIIFESAVKKAFADYQLEVKRLGSKTYQFNDKDSGIFALRNMEILASTDIEQVPYIKDKEFYKPKGISRGAKESSLIHDREEFAHYYAYEKLTEITEDIIRHKLEKLHKIEAAYLQTILYESSELFEELEAEVSIKLDSKKTYLYKLAFNKNKLAANNNPDFIEQVKQTILKEQANCTISEGGLYYYLEIGIDDLRAGKRITILNNMKEVDDESHQMLKLTLKEQQIIVKRLTDALVPNSDEAIGILIQACTELGNLSITISPTVRYEVDCHNLFFILENNKQNKANVKEDLIDKKIPDEWLSVKYISEIMAQPENAGIKLLSLSPPAYPAHEVSALGATAIETEGNSSILQDW